MTTPMNELEMLLERWANFYLITSAAAATLIGLLFVVITLASERRVEEVEATAKIRVYLTPTVVYFASVLGLAALLSFPNHTRLTATVCICLVGVVGLVYSGSSLIRGDKKKSYDERRDLIPYAAFPFAAYGLLVLGGVLLLHDTQRGLTFVAVGMLSLLTIAIRNSWAIAIALISTRPRRH
ncbi:MAG: hypothetical protein ACLQJ7_07405 [Syntrophobacteraceae bacterium]